MRGKANMLQGISVAVLLVIGSGLCNAQTGFVPDPADTDGNFGNDVVYYVLVDRFFDGEPSNNVPAYAFPDTPSLSPELRKLHAAKRTLLQMTYDPGQRYMGLYWGGDLQGVIDKLDYLADLGVTKLILSPINENAVGFFKNDGANFFLHRSLSDEGGNSPYASLMTAYHGYWTRDWFQIDPHFRNPQDEAGDTMKVFRTLLNEAAKRGIGVMLDITLNHTSPIVDSFPEGGNICSGDHLVASFNLAQDRLHDVGWFHRYRPIDFSNPSQKELEEGTLLGGMPDLNQDVSEVERYLLSVVKFWMDFNKDQGGASIVGFRVDAIKHVNIDFWQDFESYVLSHNPSAILMGEYFSGGYFNPASVDFIDKTKYFSQYDFNLSESARHFFAGDRQWDGRTYVLRELVLGRQRDPGWAHHLVDAVLNPGGILEVPKRSLQLIADKDAATWAGFLENHDLPRLRTSYPGMSDASYESAVEFLFAIPRVPILVYGTETGLAVPYDPREQGLFGIGGDPFNRPMMIFPGQPGWNENIYQVTKTMVKIRKRFPLLRYGESEFLDPRGSSSTGDLFLLRIPDPTDKAESGIRILFAYSTHGGSFPLDVSAYPQKSGWDVESGNPVSPDASGSVMITLEPRRSRVFVFGAPASSPGEPTAAAISKSR